MSLDKVKGYASDVRDQYRSQLGEMVSIPSISAREENRKDCFRMLEWVGAFTESMGLKPRIVETKGHPAFVASLENDPSLPWITLYNHMDVQPADEPQWVTSPFEPILEETRVIGRGSTDDKGPALSILHAIKFLKDNNIPFPNVQVVYETEEEIGSPFFGQFLDDNQDLLKNPQSILVSDTIFEGENPAITYKLKGMVRMEIELKTGSKDLHSGIFGNGVVNPVSLLIHALGTCTDRDGKIQIEGVMKDVKELTQRELTELAKVAQAFDLEKFRNDSGGATLYTSDPKEILSRTWHEPTFEIHGFEGAQWEPGVLKSAIPYHVKAKVSMRLVPGQEPDQVVQAVQEHLKKFHPDIVVHSLGGQKASFTPLSEAIFESAIEACNYGFGRKPLFVGCGGTIGAIPQFQRVYPKAPVVLIAQSLMSDGYHAPNEEFQLIQGERGIATMAKYIHSQL